MLKFSRPRSAHVRANPIHWPKTSRFTCNHLRFQWKSRALLRPCKLAEATECEPSANRVRTRKNCHRTLQVGTSLEDVRQASSLSNWKRSIRMNKENIRFHPKTRQKINGSLCPNLCFLFVFPPLRDQHSNARHMPGIRQVSADLLPIARTLRQRNVRKANARLMNSGEIINKTSLIVFSRTERPVRECKEVRARERE